MTKLSAFVGHSFTKEDAPVVVEFLKFFDRLKKLLPEFSWEHAEEAEAKVLTDKVLKLIEGKNLFIGICTKKELVIPPASLGNALFRKTLRTAEVDKFEWKTSDWVIQEIGMAVARGLNLILLIENGVRKPGGLQGDIEYISFLRDAPHESFNKILEMIAALSPKSIGNASPTNSGAQDQNPSGEQTPSSETSTDWTTPQPNWTRDQFELGIWHYIYSDDEAKIEMVNQAYLATAGTDPEKAATWKAHNEFTRIAVGKRGQLDALESIVDEFPLNAEVRKYYAKALARFDKPVDAGVQFELAAINAADDSIRAELNAEAAKQFTIANDARAEGALFALKGAFHAGLIKEETLLEGLIEIAILTKDSDYEIALMERLVELRPNDFYRRFALAYKHGETNNEDLSLYHYMKIPARERDALAWNNLGVAFDRFKMPGKAVEAFERSEEKVNSLAMANLGFKALRAGFTTQAKTYCDKALAVENYHKNVGQLLAQITELPDDEEKKRDEVIDKAKPKAVFYERFGRAFISPRPEALDGFWIGPECTLKMERNGNHLTMTGQFQTEINSLFQALGGGDSRRTYNVRYSGQLQGHAIRAEISKKPTDGFSTLLDDISTKVLMYIDGTINEIRVVENPSGAVPKFYSFKRAIPTLPAS